jgi:hypothetical protein
MADPQPQDKPKPQSEPLPKLLVEEQPAVAGEELPGAAVAGEAPEMNEDPAAKVITLIYFIRRILLDIIILCMLPDR